MDVFSTVLHYPNIDISNNNISITLQHYTGIDLLACSDELLLSNDY